MMPPILDVRFIQHTQETVEVAAQMEAKKLALAGLNY